MEGGDRREGKFGGTCVNNGCTPTKAMVASAYAAHIAGCATDYGVMVETAPRST
jgi:pyruvate/2-oxoglutarate dehydrogenase complex dihydrolipoamide dehydrogenase (E3) component